MTTATSMRFLTIVALAAALVSAPGCDDDAGENEALREASARFFRRHDANGDGKLSRDELPPAGKRLFGRIDADADGFITPEEDLAFRAARRARLQEPTRVRRPALRAPTHANLRYGPHERNVLDLWLASVEEPTPVVVYFHGGGFRGGDKRTLNPELLERLLAAGVAVAAANYRLTSTAPFPAPMHDAARAVQFLRHHAEEHNLDPRRIGATGGSAGAGISLWLALHDDLADPTSEDVIARQSTRISCAVVYAAQTSYDPRFIQEIFDTDRVEGALLPFFGLSGPEDVEDPAFHDAFEEASAITHASKDDPPVYLYYPQPNEELPANSAGNRHIHHPKFGFVLKEKLDALGVECIVRLREDVGRRAPCEEYVAFFLAQFEERARGSPATPSENVSPR